MAVYPTSRRGDRNAILRGVYEENLRVRDGSPRRSAPPKPTHETPLPKRKADVQTSNWKTIVILVGVFVVLAGVVSQLGSDHPGRSSATAAILPSSADTSAGLLRGVQSMVERSSVSPLQELRPSVADLYGLQLKTIVIDAGHGGRDPGAIGQEGLAEKDVTLDIALRLKERLEKYPDYRVLLTRDRDNTMTLRERIDYANELGADLFISLHINWLPDDTIAPIETYFYGPNSDARIVRMATQENKNSGFSHADFDDLTRQLGVELKIEESTMLARSIQDGLYRNMRQLNGQVSDWGAKSGDFMVLLGVRAPSVLAEIGSISNRAEEEKLRTPSYREKLAFFLEEGLINYLRQYDNEDEQTEHAGQES